MAVTAADVKALRDATGAGMMDCKRALQEADGDVEQARDLLRQQGLAKGEKRAGRATAEGAVAVAAAEDKSSAVALVLNCETDFVGRSDDFRALAQELANAALAKGTEDPEALEAEGELNDAISRIGEVIRIGQIVRVVAGGGVVGAYLHTATHKVAALVELGVEGDAAPTAAAEVGREVGMQVVAMQPLCIDRAGVPADRLEREKGVLLQAADMAKKPPQIQEKIVEGRLGKFYGEVCLLEQAFAKDPEKTVQQVLDEKGKELGAKLTVVRVERVEVGRDEQ